MRVEQVAQAESATAPGVTAASEWCTSRRTIDLSKPALMGVLNITPDSFSDGGLYLNKEAALVRLEELQADGADIVDIGGESTRPGARAVERDEELRRVMPVVEAASERLDVAISIDTTKTSVARAALDAGAEIINDISGLTFDPGLAELAAERSAGLVLMHIRGKPRTMQGAIHYDDLIGDVGRELGEATERACAAGCDRRQLVIDPGIGFGKTAEQNLLLIQHLGPLVELGYPVLIGPSRKSFMGKILGLELQDRLEATIAACVVALVRGARIFRVHDVQPVRRALDMAEAIVTQSSSAEST